MKIVYIMGLGRSGSTLLDVILGNHPAHHSIGQFANMVGVGWKQSTTCSCGRSCVECPFWSDVRERWHRQLGSHSEREYEKVRELFERISRGPVAVPTSRFSSKRFGFYLESTAALYRSVFEVCGRKNLVDSSKVPLRALHLSRIDEIDLRIIHAVRDGRAAAFSWKKPSKRKPRDVTSTAIDWMATNLLCEWVLREASTTRSLRVRYEDFVDDPVTTLNSIGKLIDENMEPVISRLLNNEPMSVTHVATGNRLRLEKGIRLRPDREWQTSMSDKDRRRVWAITWPLMTRYGYPRVTRPQPVSGTNQDAQRQDRSSPAV